MGPRGMWNRSVLRWEFLHRLPFWKNFILSFTMAIFPYENFPRDHALGIYGILGTFNNYLPKAPFDTKFSKENSFLHLIYWGLCDIGPSCTLGQIRSGASSPNKFGVYVYIGLDILIIIYSFKWVCFVQLCHVERQYLICELFQTSLSCNKTDMSSLGKNTSSGLDSVCICIFHHFLDANSFSQHAGSLCRTLCRTKKMATFCCLFDNISTKTTQIIPRNFKRMPLHAFKYHHNF